MWPNLKTCSTLLDRIALADCETRISEESVGLPN
jgi:hypothetical protein